MKDQNLALLNCGDERVRIDFVCPMTWDTLEKTEHARQRFCASCQKRVTLCVNAQEAVLRADQNECIAVPAWFAEGTRRDDRVLIVGMPQRRKDWAKVVEDHLNEGACGDPSAG